MLLAHLLSYPCYTGLTSALAGAIITSYQGLMALARMEMKRKHFDRAVEVYSDVRASLYIHTYETTIDHSL